MEDLNKYHGNVTQPFFHEGLIAIKRKATMKSLVIFFALALSPIATKAAAFKCDCIGSICPLESKPISVQYDPKTLFFNVSGANWEYKGYVTSQTSKVTGVTYLTLPRSYTFAGGTIEIRNEEGNSREIFISGEHYHCVGSI